MEDCNKLTLQSNANEMQVILEQPPVCDERSLLSNEKENAKIVFPTLLNMQNACCSFQGKRHLKTSEQNLHMGAL